MVSISEVEKTIALLSKAKSKICVFLGAGVDVSSGGLLFNSLKNATIEKFSDFSSGALDEKDKNIIFENIIDDNPEYHTREILLNNINDNRFKISDGYRILLLMARYGIIDAIVSTNFFDFLEKSQGEMGINTIDTYINEYNHHMLTYDDEKTIYLKLHGDASRYFITHVTEDEINNKDYSSQTVNLFTSYLKDHTLLFIGYSGNDTKINNLIENNINQINQVFFINIQYNTSPLTSLLEKHKKFQFCSASFDEFMTSWGITQLSGIKIFDTYPLLIESLLDARAEQSTAEIRKDKSFYVERPAADEVLQSFCHTAFICGTAGIGKTSLIKHYISTLKKNQAIYIDLKNNNKINAIDEIASVLGFSSDVPVALLHKLCSWYERNQKYITFLIDGIADYNSYIDEILLLAKLNEKNEYVSFVFSSRKQYFNTVCEIELSSKNSIILEEFSDDDVSKMIEFYNLDNKLLTADKALMREPYICSIICNFYKGIHCENEGRNVFEIIESTLERKFKIPCSKIHKCFIEIASSTYAKVTESTKEIYEKIFPCGLLCAKPDYKFKYDKLIEYYLYCYFIRSEQERQKHIVKLQNLLYDDKYISKTEYMAFQYIYTSATEISEIQNSIINMDKLIMNCGDKDPATSIKFVRECLLAILHSDESKYIKSVCSISISLLSKEMKFLISTTAHFLTTSGAAYEVWQWAYSEKSLRYSTFIYCMDKICAELTSINSEEKIREYYENNISLFMLYNDTEDIAVFLYILMRLDITDEHTQLACSFAIDKVKKLLKSDFEKCHERLYSILKQYSYNILFNSDKDIEADYNSILYNEQIHSIINDVVSGKAVSSSQLLDLIQSGDILNNMVLFLLCNLIVVYSASNDKATTIANINSVIDGKSDFLPEEIDFILSCTFMSLFQSNPKDRKGFTDIFNKICDKYETLLFEQPSTTRKSTNRKFADQFEIVFEDGFNPTAFLFYTAPIDKGGHSLAKYGSLCETLAENGNYDKILKIVHAIGQMISVYPVEGLIELKKLLRYDEKIVRRGIIRVLTESYQRYPNETLNFIKSNDMRLTSDEEKYIFGSTTEFLKRRTLEQLHWSRLIYAVTMSDSEFIPKLINCFFTQTNLSNFIAQVLY